MGILDFFTKSSAPVVAPSLPASSNTKLLIVDNAEHAQLVRVLTDFCKLYNKTSPQVQLLLTPITATRHAIVFPQYVTFENFCFLVNYLHYPADEEWNARIFAWDTLTISNYWFGAEYAASKIILFVPPDDTEYDNVFVTTENNAGFKLSFGIRSKAQLLNAPKELFAPAPLHVAALLAAGGQLIQ